MSGVERIGNHERESAMEALRQHATAGRITPAEYEDRSVEARAAKTWAELDALFTDLPAPGPAELRAQTLASRPPIGEPAIPGPQRSGWVPEPYGYTITALAPIAAVILFFVTNSWLWFLLIPAVGAIVYGPDGDHRQREKREKRRRRREGT